MPVAKYKPELQQELRNKLVGYMVKGVKLSIFSKKSKINYMTLYSFVLGDRNLGFEKLESLVSTVKQYEQE